MAIYLFTLFGLAMAGAIALAFRLGGRDEKLVALALVVAALATPLVQSSSFELAQHGIIVVDVLLLLVLGHVALTSDRYWPLFAAGFHFTTILFHVARSTGAGIVPDAYADLIVFWSYLVIAALIAGTLTEAADRQQKQTQP